LPHLRSDGGNEGGGSFEVDRENLAAMRFGDGIVGVAVENGGIVDESVNFADCLDKRRNCAGIAKVEIYALADNFGSELLIESQDAPSGGNESAGGGQTDAAAGTRDESGIHSWLKFILKTAVENEAGEGSS
jgi:hypothetical protein